MKFKALLFLLFVAFAVPCFSLCIKDMQTEIFECPDAGSQVVGMLHKYDPIKVIDKKAYFSKITTFYQRNRSMDGWVRNEQILKRDTLVVISIQANARIGPGKKYAKQKMFYQGYILDVLDKNGDWYKVKPIDPEEETVLWINRINVWPCL